MSIVYTHQPLPVLVQIEKWDGTLIHDYTIDWNDPKQRAVFAEQANNAIRNHQIVITSLEN